MVVTAVVFSLIVFVGDGRGGLISQGVADYTTIQQCEEAKQSIEDQVKSRTGLFKAAAVCIPVPSFTSNN